MKPTKTLKKLGCVLAAALLMACSGMPSNSGVGAVSHPDPFHSYID